MHHKKATSSFYEDLEVSTCQFYHSNWSTVGCKWPVPRAGNARSTVTEANYTVRDALTTLCGAYTCHPWSSQKRMWTCAPLMRDWVSPVLTTIKDQSTERLQLKRRLPLRPNKTSSQGAIHPIYNKLFLATTPPFGRILYLRSIQSPPLRSANSFSLQRAIHGH